MERKQSTTTYSKLVATIQHGNLQNTKIIYSFAVSYFLVTYLGIVPDMACVLLA